MHSVEVHTLFRLYLQLPEFVKFTVLFNQIVICTEFNTFTVLNYRNFVRILNG